MPQPLRKTFPAAAQDIKQSQGNIQVCKNNLIQAAQLFAGPPVPENAHLAAAYLKKGDATRHLQTELNGLYCLPDNLDLEAMAEGFEGIAQCLEQSPAQDWMIPVPLSHIAAIKSGIDTLREPLLNPPVLLTTRHEDREAMNRGLDGITLFIAPLCKHLEFYLTSPILGNEPRF